MLRKYLPNIMTVIVAVGMVAVLAWLGISGRAEDNVRLASGPPLPALESNEYAVPRPPFSEGIYPCTQCHNADLPPNTMHRTLRMAHKDIQAILHHDGLWCLDCHNTDNRDVLRSASGAAITFEESYKLCGQCHGEKLRDWKAGVHGKRTGLWNGKKSYLLCVNCHSPHSPRFQPMKPLPPPVPPGAVN